MKVKRVMPGQVEGRQCGGKICYTNKTMALKAMKSAREKRKTRKAHIERRVYRCPACHFWHVTSRSIEKSKALGALERQKWTTMRGIESTLSDTLPADEAFEVLARMNEDRLSGKRVSSADNYIGEVDKEIEGSEELKDSKESKESKDSEELKDSKESKESKDSEELKGSKDSKDSKELKDSEKSTADSTLKGITPLDGNNSILDKNNHSSDSNNKLLDANNDERTGNMSYAVPTPADVIGKRAVVYASKDIKGTVKRVPVSGGVLLILPKNVVVMSPEKSKALRHLGIVEEL